MKTRSWVVLFCGLVLAFAAFAHGNEQHVMGIVTQVSSDSITVKTTANAMVNVALMKETQFTMAKSPAKLTDLQVGDRVVIHAMMHGDKLTAHTVEFSRATAPH